MPDFADSLLSLAESQVILPGLRFSYHPIMNTPSASDIAFVIYTQTPLPPIRDVVLASNVPGQNPASSGNVSFTRPIPGSYYTWKALPSGGFYPPAAPDGGPLGRAELTVTYPANYNQELAYPLNDCICQATPLSYTAEELANMGVIQDKVDNKFYRYTPCGVYAGFAPPLLYNIGAWYAIYGPLRDAFGTNYNGWSATKLSAPLPNLIGDQSSYVAESWRQASPGEGQGTGAAPGFRGWIQTPNASIVNIDRARYWYACSFSLAVAPYNPGGDPKPPTPPKDSDGDADRGVALLRSVMNVPHLFYIKGSRLWVRSATTASSYKPDNEDTFREVEIKSEGEEAPATGDSASGEEDDKSPDCRNPCAWDRYGAQECVFLDRGKAFLARSFDLWRTQSVIRIENVSYSRVTATQHGARILLAGYKSGQEEDEETDDTTGNGSAPSASTSGDPEDEDQDKTGWFIHVGTMATDGTYSWSEAKQIELTDTPGASGQLRVRDDGVIEFAYVSDAGLPKIVSCSLLAQDGSGDWY